MKEWWDSLQARERMIVTVLGGVVALVVVYFILLRPLADARARLRADTKSQQATLAWMQQAGQEIQQLRRQSSAGGASANRSMLSIVDSSAKKSGLRKPITRMEPDGDNAVKLWVDDAEFDALVRWLGELQRTFAVQVGRASFSRTDSPGVVDSRLTLERL
ncbi:MAG: type II secretion system protein GspM [Gammaproteobacteria bacterium]